jgi:hypothetical protein
LISDPTGSHRRGPASGTRALAYLARVGDAQPATSMLRAEALHWAGKPVAAVTILDGLQNEVARDQHAEGATLPASPCALRPLVVFEPDPARRFGPFVAGVAMARVAAA